MGKYLVIIAAALSVCASTYAQTDTTLTIGTNAEYAPFTYREGGEIVGFDIDVAKEVSKRLHKGPKFKDMPFEALIPDVMMGKVDFIAAGMTMTEERAKRVAFTRPYMESDPLVVMTLVTPLTLDELKGKKVVVNEGFNADIFMTDKPGIKLIRLPTIADAFIALTSKRADAFVTAKSTADSYFATQDASKFATVVLEGTAENCALVLSKTNNELLVQIQNALDEMEQDGTLAQVKKKWGFE